MYLPASPGDVLSTLAMLRGGVIDRRVAVWLLALCFALRLVSLFRPSLSDDEATYAVVGREMLAGRVLYRDIVDHKPPAIYLLNAATQAIGGPVGGMILLHVVLIVVVWATGMVLGAIANRWTADRRSGAVAALLWIVFTTTLVDTDSLAANCELFMMLPLAASLLAAISQRWFAAGVLVGIAIGFKYQAAIQLPLYGIAIIARYRQEPAAVVRAGAALTLGVGLPVLAALAWLWMSGAADAAWFWFRFNFAYISTGSSSAMVWQAALRVGFVIAAAAPLYVCAARAIRGRVRPLALGWLAVSGLAVIVGGRFFGHYFHQLTAPLAVIAAPVALTWYDRRRRSFVLALAIPACVFVALAFAHDWVMRAAGQPDPDYRATVAWLDSHAAATDSICIWGNSPVLYFEAARPLGCRFVFANYLTGLSPATPSQTDPTVDSSPNEVPAAWDMLEADLTTRRPAFLIDASPGNVGYYGKYPPENYPRLANVLACDYSPAVEIDGMRIYQRLKNSRCTS